MKSALLSVLGATIAMAFAGPAVAQSAVRAASAPSAPMAAASTPIPSRSPAVKAAENANEPGKLRPEQRVIPQISLPLKRSGSPLAASPAASLPAGSVPGAVNDGAARCLATVGAKEKAACERGLVVTEPPKLRL